MGMLWRKKWLNVIIVLASLCGAISIGLLAMWWGSGGTAFLKLAALYGLAALALVGLWGVLGEVRRLSKRRSRNFPREELLQQ